MRGANSRGPARAAISPPKPLARLFWDERKSRSDRRGRAGRNFAAPFSGAVPARHPVIAGSERKKISDCGRVLTAVNS